MLPRKLVVHLRQPDRRCSGFNEAAAQRRGNPKAAMRAVAAISASMRPRRTRRGNLAAVIEGACSSVTLQ